MASRTQQKAQTRAKIKQVAKQAFLTYGIDATSTRYLSQQANIAVGTLFVHFPDKLALVKDIFFDEMEVALRNASQHQQKVTSPVDYLQQMAHVLFVFYDDYSEFTQQVLLDSLAHGGFHTTQMAAVYDGVISRFQQVGVDENAAKVFAENMIANYWFVLMSCLPKGVLGRQALDHLKRLNLPFEMSYKNALKSR